ncbi:MAG TPA: hypothetical protein VE687_04190, partial [Stellaceae bacterium]|nr:hypothetical protein [Stellaceae bacterium]
GAEHVGILLEIVEPKGGHGMFPLDREKKAAGIPSLQCRPGCYLSPPKRFLGLMSDVAPGQPHVVEVALGPLRKLATLAHPFAPDVDGLVQLGKKSRAMMICHSLIGESGHFQLRWLDCCC